MERGKITGEKEPPEKDNPAETTGEEVRTEEDDQNVETSTSLFGSKKPQEQGTNANSELRDDVVVGVSQEPRVNYSSSSSVFSGLAASSSSSAIDRGSSECFSSQDPLNSLRRDYSDDVDNQEQGTNANPEDEDRVVVSGIAASSSVINQGSKKTEFSSSPRNVESSDTEEEEVKGDENSSEGYEFADKEKEAEYKKGVKKLSLKITSEEGTSISSKEKRKRWYQRNRPRSSNRSQSQMSHYPPQPWNRSQSQLSHYPSQPLHQNPPQPLYQNPTQPLHQNPPQPLYQNPRQPLYQNPMLAVQGSTLFPGQNIFNHQYFAMLQQPSLYPVAPMVGRSINPNQLTMTYHQQQQFPLVGPYGYFGVGQNLNPQMQPIQSQGMYQNYLNHQQVSAMHQPNLNAPAPTMYQQNQMGNFPSQGPMMQHYHFERPPLSPMYNQQQSFMRPETYQQYPYYHLPVANQSMPMMSPSGPFVFDQNYINQQLHQLTGFPIDMINQQAALGAPWYHANVRGMLLPRPRAQQPTQSQGFNTGPSSSHQGQDKNQRPR
ncbi:hypothetical protein AALP_AA6G044700 [Arabis alpina]|uniref:Uncharacterized protein n=1 Tax=Arabis alpina TaxID=50452 RepID=A0A087GM30_ARAAL|nr:hypothetical protein AALP_AA6G044700 [Arabis alpina]